MSEPSTERVPPTPAEARTVFGDRLEVAEHYVQLLATTGIDHGLIGPREAPRLWDRHVLGSGVLAPMLGPSSTLADIGSGAGLPGLVLALARPDVRVTLVEPLHRRVVWLEDTVAELALDNVLLHEGRAESLWGQQVYDAVTARAVARIGVLAGWCLPLVAPGGRLLAIKGRSISEELEEDAAEVARVGGVSPRVELVGAGTLEPPATVAVIDVGDRTPSPSRVTGSSGSARRRKSARAGVAGAATGARARHDDPPRRRLR